MPKLAANLTMLFGEIDFLDRFEAAASAGFRGVEFLFPTPTTPRSLKARLRDHRLVQVLHNLPAGNWTAGERGIACHPDRVDEFKAGVDQAITYATALDCDRVNCLAGILPPQVDPAAARDTFVQNLRYAAPRLQSAGIRLLIEPINTRDVPGFFLSGTAQAIEIIDAVGSDNLQLQYDIYHMQIMEGDVAAGDPATVAANRAHAACRRAGTPRAGNRRDRLRLAAEPHRSRRLQRLDRMRIRPGGQNPRWTGLGRAVSVGSDPYRGEASPSTRPRAQRIAS